jgi:glycine hydroxymethyltransferase
MLKAPLATVDPEMYKIIKSEEARQFESLCLIASENFTSQAVYQCLASPLHNKYAEGYPGARYYGGCEYLDQMERLTQARALKTYRLDPAEWGVNVQPLSGSPANLAAYWGVLPKGARLVGLSLNSGGHLSHGFEIPTKKVSATADYFEWMHYSQDSEGNIDYAECLDVVTRFRPKMVTAGFSSYTRNFDYKRLREISDTVGAYLLSDMAHISGLVATGNAPSPF